MNPKLYVSKFKELILISSLIISDTDKKKIKFIFLGILFTAILELVGLGFILPIIEILLNGKNHSYLNFLGRDLSLINAMAILLIIYFVKSIFILAISKYQFKVIYNLSSKLSKKLYFKNINQNYIFFSKNNTSEYLRNVYNECTIFSNGIVLILIKIFSDLIIFLFILIFLIFFNPIVTFSLVLYLSIITLFYIYFLRNRIKILGEKRTYHESRRIKLIQEGFRSFEFLKIFNLQNFFTDKYDFHNKSSHKVFIKERFYGIIPRVVLEFFIILFLVALMYFFLNSQTPVEEIIVIISLFTLASLKLLPIFNSFYHNFQVLQFNYPVAKNLNNNLELKTSINKIEDPININSKIELKNVSFSYPTTDKVILDNINILFNLGDIISISGPSGSGKSTLLNLIIGSLMPDKGKIIIDNNEIKNYFRINNLTYVPQTTFLIDDTLKNNIILNRKYNLEKYMTALKYSGLLDYYSSLTNKDENLGENAAKISGGQMQRISIARAIYDSPKLIILDEPTSSIDKETTLEIYKNLKLLNKNTNCTIITVSHDDIPEDFASVNYYVNNGNIVKKK